MSAHDPMFPVSGSGTREEYATRMIGCSQLLFCMLAAPALEQWNNLTPEDEAQYRRAWAEALIKESER